MGKVRIRFLGAAGTVTGSKYLVQGERHQVLVDAGLFQGARKWRERNWHQPQCNVEKIDAVLLTHAHIDHTGILPRYVKLGLHCPVFATKATTALCNVLLPDSGELQEEMARYRDKHGKSRHSPPLPLYKKNDAIAALKLFQSVPWQEKKEILPGVFAEWRQAGHILGAASVVLHIDNREIVFSGDIGRYDVPILRNPEDVPAGDLLLVESTYGTRNHPESDPKDTIERIVAETAARKGVVLIPSFAVGRTQLLLFYLRELIEEKKIPNIPVIVDSPMATDATEIYREFPDDYDEEALGILREGRRPFQCPKLYFTRSRRESIKLNSIAEPMIIISASGMLSGGRILHHLKHRISSPLNTLLFVGYQPPGGRGAWIKSGAESLTLLGEKLPIRAQIAEVSGLSAHAGKDELSQWCQALPSAPHQTAVVHGEPESAKAMAKELDTELGWNTFAPNYLEEIEV